MHECSAAISVNANSWMNVCTHESCHRIYRHTFVQMLHQCAVVQAGADAHTKKVHSVRLSGWGQLRSSSVVSWWFRRTLGSSEPNLPCQGIVARNLPPTPSSLSVSPGSPLSSGASTCPGWFDTGPTSHPGPCLVQQ